MARDDHWMLTATRDGAPLPEIILRRWRWFKRAAARARRGYAATELIAICSAAAVPVAAGIHLHAAVLAALGAAVIVATGLRTTFGLHENWIESIRLRYQIERECALFLVGAAPYADGDAAVRTLVTRVEDLSAALNTQWTERRSKMAAMRPPVFGDGAVRE